MKTLLLFVLCLSCFWACNTPQETYCNKRFSYCIVYPDVFEPIGESQNGDGQIFYAENGSVELAVWGSVNGVGRTIAEEKAFVSTNRTVVYETLNDSFFVISGYEEDKVFYRRTEATDNGFRSFEIRYPKLLKDKYDKIVEQIAFQGRE